MENRKYIISDASKMVGVESHVLRYWEEELGICVARNELGHRCYSAEDVDRLCTVKSLKDKGFQLKAIKALLPQLDRLENMDDVTLLDLRDRLEAAIVNEEERQPKAPDNLVQIERVRAEISSAGDDKSAAKMQRFRGIMSDIVSEALLDNNEVISRKISNYVRDSVLKELDYLFRVSEEREEERFRQLDRTIREYQESKHRAAAAREPGLGLFKKRNH